METKQINESQKQEFYEGKNKGWIISSNKTILT